MTMYIIKGTYLEGVHKGKVFYLNKGGYVVDIQHNSVWKEDAYTEKGCKIACSRMTKNNEAENIAEKRVRAYRESKGLRVSPLMLYELQSFEPFAIETVNS